MQRAGFGIRLGALLIDGVILFVINWIVSAIVRPKIDPTNMDFQQIMAAAVAGARRVALFTTVIYIAYTLTEVFKAASPGKMALKLKIISQTGNEATPDQLWKRWAVKFGVSMGLGLLWAITGFSLFWGLQALVGLVIFGGCFMALGANRQALHDVIAGTAVRQPAPAGFAPQGFQPVMPPPTGAAVPPPPPVPPQA
jgi:uncharacterized RDD family membrane protein YckC